MLVIFSLGVARAFQKTVSPPLVRSAFRRLRHLPEFSWLTGSRPREFGGRPVFAGIHSKRQSSSAPAPEIPRLDYAFAFDIDGVLMLGSNPIPAGVRAMQLLSERRIPFILLTNGGGKWEEDRVAELSERLGVNVPPSSVY
jgi:Haloacid dehalogenase-like hydrolase